MGAAFRQVSSLSTQGSNPSPGLRTNNTHQNQVTKPDKIQHNFFTRNDVSQDILNSSTTLGAKYNTYKREELDSGKSCASEIKTNQEIEGASFCLRGLKTISTIRGSCATIPEQAAEDLPRPSRSTSRRLFLVRSLLQLLAAVVVGHIMQFGEVAGKFDWLCLTLILVIRYLTYYVLCVNLSFQTFRSNLTNLHICQHWATAFKIVQLFFFWFGVLCSRVNYLLLREHIARRTFTSMFNWQCYNRCCFILFCDIIFKLFFLVLTIIILCMFLRACPAVVLHNAASITHLTTTSILCSPALFSLLDKCRSKQTCWKHSAT